jgi:hypothetical protein
MRFKASEDVERQSRVFWGPGQAHLWKSQPQNGIPVVRNCSGNRIGSNIVRRYGGAEFVDLPPRKRFQD